MKKYKFFLNDDVRNEIQNWMEDKINLNNSAALYYSSKLFNLSKPSLWFIERCFPMFVDSHNFLELDFMSVSKILSSSGLNVDSELQVFNAADAWLSHNKERNKHASYIYSKIRFLLLSIPARSYISNKLMRLNTDLGVNNKATLHVKEDFYTKNNITTSRYCNQEKFNIIVCGGYDVDRFTPVSDVFNILVNNIYSVYDLPQLNLDRKFSNAVCIQNSVYVFGGRDDNNNRITSIEKYSPFTNTWEIVGDVYDRRSGFCACSFIDKLYVIGGFSRLVASTSCIEFDTKHLKWNEIAGMNEARYESACAVFEGRIVVSGGINRGQRLNTVEAYDHVANSWSYMPNMVKTRNSHKSVAIKNKLFVVGGDLTFNGTTFEVFSSTCNNFVLIKPPKTWVTFLQFSIYVTSIGSELVVLNGGTNTILFYDDSNNKWSEKILSELNHIDGFCCAKVPQY